MKILLVDDSRKHRESGATDLSADGHEVVAVRSYGESMKVADASFDVALIDLLMPAEGMTLGEKGMEHFGEPFAIGYPLSIYLASKGIKRVAVATDSNHHDHPASAIMDYVGMEKIVVGESSIIWMHSPMKENDAKNWKAVLEKLMAI